MKKYRVYHAPEGGDPSYCGEFDTLDEAIREASEEPSGMPKFMWDTAQSAGHCAGLTAPDTDGVEDEEPIGWHGEAGYHCVVGVTYPDPPLTLRRGYDGYHETIDVDADADYDGDTQEWVTDGEWGEDGAAIDYSWELYSGDELIDQGGGTVDIEPNHEHLIKQAVVRYPPDDFCGFDPEDHEWTSEGEGGCDENPGVWSMGGTAMTFRSHCKNCGLCRTENSTGAQRNPGEHDTVEYEMPEESEVDRD